MKISKCVFPVAGLGTRFLPVTKELAKEMLPLVNRPIISYGVEEALASGCEEIIMITGRAKRSLEDYFDRSFELEELLKSRGKLELCEKIVKISNMAEILFIRQREPLGLGHAVLCAEPVCKSEYFAVALPDDVFINRESPVLSQLVKVHEKMGGTVIALEEVAPENVSRYGIVKSQFEIEPGLHKIIDMIEKPRPEEAPSNLAIMGRYVLSPTIFEILKEQKAGTGGEIQLTDAMAIMARKEPITAYEFPGTRHDMGSKIGFLKANVSLGVKNPDFGDEFKTWLKDFAAKL